MDTEGRARHPLLLLFPTHNLTTLNRDKTLSTRKKEGMGVFFKADVFLSFPSSPRGNQGITKPINTLLPGKEPDPPLSPARHETLQTPTRLPGSLLGSSRGGGTCCPPWLLPKCQHLPPWRPSASPHPETLQIAFFSLYISPSDQSWHCSNC